MCVRLIIQTTPAPPLEKEGTLCRHRMQKSLVSSKSLRSLKSLKTTKPTYYLLHLLLTTYPLISLLLNTFTPYFTSSSLNHLSFNFL